MPQAFAMLAARRPYTRKMTKGLIMEITSNFAQTFGSLASAHYKQVLSENLELSRIFRDGQQIDLCRKVLCNAASDLEEIELKVGQEFDSQEFIELRAKVAVSLYSLGLTDECRQVIERLRKTYENAERVNFDSAECKNVLSVLIRTLRECALAQDIVPLLQSRLSKADRQFASAYDKIAEYTVRLADELVLVGRREEAARLYERAVGLIDEGKPDRTLIHYMQKLERVYRDLGRDRAAKAFSVKIAEHRITLS